MADTLATPSDLASLLQSDLDLSTATLLLEAATGIVQATAGQRIVRATSTANIPAPWGSYLDLPQWPVVSVSSVEIDGSAITDHKLIGVRLWRLNGWQTSTTPAVVTVAYTHGYAVGDQALQLARSAVLALCAPVYSNPAGASEVKIDDYAEAYSTLAARMDASANLRDALRSQYGGAVGAVPMRTS